MTKDDDIKSTYTLEHDGIEWWIEKIGDNYWEFEAIAFPPETTDGYRPLPERIEGAADSKERCKKVIDWWIESMREGTHD